MKFSQPWKYSPNGFDIMEFHPGENYQDNQEAIRIADSMGILEKEPVPEVKAAAPVANKAKAAAPRNKGKK